MPTLNVLAELVGSEWDSANHYSGYFYHLYTVYDTNLYQIIKAN